MIRLVGVELRRTMSRRALRFLSALILLGIVIAGVTAFVRSSNDLAAKATAVTADFNQRKQECLQHPEEFGGFKQVGPDGSVIIIPEPGPPGANQKPQTPEQVCGDTFNAENLKLEIEASDPRFHLTKFDHIIKGIAAPLLILCLLIGATSIGAEWHHRTITTLLTWEPRRTRVIVAKIVSAAIVGAIFVVVFDALLGVTLIPAAAFRGTTAGTTAHWLHGVAGTGLRAAAAGSVASVIGISIATLGRNTVAAIGIAFGYFAVLESLIRARYHFSQMWLFTDNVAAWVTHDSGIFSFGSRTTLQSGLLLGLYAFGIAVLATMSFRARDIG